MAFFTALHSSEMLDFQRHARVVVVFVVVVFELSSLAVKGVDLTVFHSV